MNKIILTSLIFVLLFSSCTVEKMRYSRGYHIEWIGKKNHTVSTKNKKDTKLKYVINTPQKTEVNLVESNEDIKSVSDSKIKKDPKIKFENTKNSQLISLKTHKIISSKKPEKKAEIKTEIRKRNPKNITQKHTLYKSEKAQLVGIALFLISILFAVLGYVFFITLGIFFGPIFLVIFLIAAGIFLIAGILSLIF